MLKISEAASLAIHSSVYLASMPEDRSATVAELAEILRVSQAHLGKVLQRLAKLGLITSRRGPGGGYRIGSRGLDATLLDIYEAIEAPMKRATCVDGSNTCVLGNCVLEQLYRTVYDDVRSKFAGTTVAEAATAQAAA